MQKRRQKMAINVIHTAKYRKYMHVGFAINLIQTAKYRKNIYCICTLKLHHAHPELIKTPSV